MNRPLIQNTEDVISFLKHEGYLNSAVTLELMVTSLKQHKEALFRMAVFGISAPIITALVGYLVGRYGK